jgi:hypothetical protein
MSVPTSPAKTPRSVASEDWGDDADNVAGPRVQPDHLQGAQPYVQPHTCTGASRVINAPDLRRKLNLLQAAKRKIVTKPINTIDPGHGGQQTPVRPARRPKGPQGNLKAGTNAGVLRRPAPPATRGTSWPSSRAGLSPASSRSTSAARGAAPSSTQRSRSSSRHRLHHAHQNAGADQPQHGHGNNNGVIHGCRKKDGGRKWCDINTAALQQEVTSLRQQLAEVLATDDGDERVPTPHRHPAGVQILYPRNVSYNVPSILRSARSGKNPNVGHYETAYNRWRRLHQPNAWDLVDLTTEDDDCEFVAEYDSGGQRVFRRPRVDFLVECKSPGCTMHTYGRDIPVPVHATSINHANEPPARARHVHLGGPQL